MTDGEEQGEAAVKVVRDETFMRAVADHAVVYDLGRDIELAFLQVGARPLLRADLGDAYEFTSEATIAEVARIRVSPPGATRLAMSILREQVAKDRVHVDKIIESLKEWDETARAARDAPDQKSAVDD